MVTTKVIAAPAGNSRAATPEGVFGSRRVSNSGLGTAFSCAAQPAAGVPRRDATSINRGAPRIVLEATLVRRTSIAGRPPTTAAAHTVEGSVSRHPHPPVYRGW